MFFYSQFTRSSPLKNHHDSDTLWIYGYHAVSAAIENEQRKILKILSYKKYEQDLLIKLHKRLSSTNPSVLKITDKFEIEKYLPENSVHQGIILQTMPLKHITINDLTSSMPEDSKQILILLDGVSDTRNIGNIIRSATAFEVSAIIFTKHSFPKENSMMVKSAAGAIEKIKLVEVTNLQNAILHLKKNDFWIIGLDAHAEQYLHEVHPFPKICLVFGSEGEGMRSLTQKSCDFLAKIPINSNSMESLNITNAVAISLYEMYKKP